MFYYKTQRKNRWKLSRCQNNVSLITHLIDVTCEKIPHRSVGPPRSDFVYKPCKHFRRVVSYSTNKTLWLYHTCFAGHFVPKVLNIFQNAIHDTPTRLVTSFIIAILSDTYKNIPTRHK